MTTDMVIMIIAVTVWTSVRYVTSNRTSLLKGSKAYLGRSFLGMRNQPPGAYLRRGKPPPRSYLLHASTTEPSHRTTSIDLHTIQGTRIRRLGHMKATKSSSAPTIDPYIHLVVIPNLVVDFHLY
jgi:hypothetical protein